MSVTYKGVTYDNLTIETVRLLNDYSSAFKKVDLAKQLDEAMSVAAGDIADGAVSTAKLADDAVTAAKLADGSVGTTKLADDAVTTLKILDTAVTEDKLADDAVTVNKIKNGEITPAKLANLGNANVLVGAVPNNVAVPISGAITMDNAGVTTLANESLGVEAIDVFDAQLSIPTSTVPYLIEYEWDSSSPDANDDIIIFDGDSPKLDILDVHLIMDQVEGGALTMTLRDAANGFGLDYTDAIDCNGNGIERATSFPNRQLAANSSLYMNFSADPGIARGRLVMLVRKQS